MGKILSYAYLLAIALIAGAYGQSHLRQSLHAIIGYQYTRIEHMVGAFGHKDAPSVEGTQTFAVVKVR